jgi:predicted MFS family arabinose efflux permease
LPTTPGAVFQRSAASPLARQKSLPGHDDGAPSGKAETRDRGRHLGVALLIIATAQLMVVLDATIVIVAQPHIQAALGFSGSSLEWVTNAYSLTLGGLLLLGGRAGDLLGRRRLFVAGLLLFSAASLAGGLATSQAWLLTARAVQGAGGAMVAPTALALIATTFPPGPPRNRAMGVYAAMSGAGGVVALVYGLSNAATSPDGTSHWGDGTVVAALAAGVVLLAAFAVIETRSRHALLPTRLLRQRDRLGANLIMLGVGTAIFGVFFFVNYFVQEIWGYSALRTGVTFLPITVVMLAASAAAATLVPRVGARPLLLTGAAATVGGLFWLSRLSEHSTYAGGLLGPMLVIGAGLGLLFVPLPLVALARVDESDSGVAASLLNVGRQVGGSIGLAVLGTVAWTVVANGARTAATRAAYQHALAVGFDRAFLVAAGIAVLILVVAIAAIRVRRCDLSGSE